jgi:hypothetical protein
MTWDQGEGGRRILNGDAADVRFPTTWGDYHPHRRNGGQISVILVGQIESTLQSVICLRQRMVRVRATAWSRAQAYQLAICEYQTWLRYHLKQAVLEPRRRGGSNSGRALERGRRRNGMALRALTSRQP